MLYSNQAPPFDQSHERQGSRRPTFTLEFLTWMADYLATGPYRTETSEQRMLEATEMGFDEEPKLPERNMIFNQES